MSVILSYGMGVDSTAILLRWLEEPATRPYIMTHDLTLLTAQVGDEWPSTRELVEGHVLPRLSDLGIRYVQVARAGPLERQGQTILDDSNTPTKCKTAGDYSLSMEYMRTGTLPQYATGCRRCTHKAKGFPLDRWIEKNAEGGYTHVIGYNADELKRVERGEGYTALGDINRKMSYPLVEWGWGRQKCLDYIKEVTGVTWEKSCCTFCPFSAEEGVVERFRADPIVTAWTLYLEYQAQAINPRTTVYKGKTLRDLVWNDGQTEAWDRFCGVLLGDDQQWAVYRARRVYDKMSYRSVEIVHRGTMGSCRGFVLRALGERDLDEDFDRVFLRNKGTEQPWGEELLVALPSMVEPKERGGFAKKWASLPGIRISETTKEDA